MPRVASAEPPVPTALPPCSLQADLAGLSFDEGEFGVCGYIVKVRSCCPVPRARFPTAPAAPGGPLPLFVGSLLAYGSKPCWQRSASRRSLLPKCP